jgi:23S rRNA (uridine2552-2'-O)-methyltransferase
VISEHQQAFPMKKKQGSSQNNKWEDHYTRKARKENFPARSVYKLQEIQEKYRLIQKGDRVLDLGCSPGSWLQYTATLVGLHGRIVGIDKKTVSLQLPSHVTVHTGDIFSIQSVMGEEMIHPYDVVLSDMAPDTTGNKSVDAARSFALCEAAFDIARHYLKSGGSFVCKIFQGEDFKPFADLIQKEFHKSKIYKPKSCRKASKEIYIIGIDKKQEEICPDTASGHP